MIKEIIPTGPIAARITVPGSKSITNRALICAALAKGDSIIRNASDSGDTILLANALDQLGVLVRREGSRLTVAGTGGNLSAPRFPIPCGNAGTTYRFLLSLASLAEGTTRFTVSDRMAHRPIEELVEALRALGVTAHAASPPAESWVRGKALRGGVASMRGDESSQFLSSLLMVAPYAAGDVTITLEGPMTSFPYLHMTVAVMRSFGVSVQVTGEREFTVSSGRCYSKTDYLVEPDASGASYFMAAAAIAGGEVILDGMTESSIQGDACFVEILRRMGCKRPRSDRGFVVRGGERLTGIDVDMNSTPDLVPTLVACALYADTPTRIRNVAHLRHKESDRLQALGAELQKLGADITAFEDGLEIRPAPLHGGLLDTYDDHRLAMSFALIGLRTPGVGVENPDCVRKSFPTFWKEFEKLQSRDI